MNQTTLDPILLNVLFNFMACSQMITSPKYEFNVTYKLGNPDFQIYQRNCHHNFKAMIDSESKEKS